MTAQQVILTVEGDVARIRINRPEARNAMTFAMYEALLGILESLRENKALRLLVVEGDDKAFVAGTEISEFTAFRSGADGLAYEAYVERVLAALETMPMPTLAAVKGVATGGGLMLAAVCDLRLMAETARVGVPIARTVGNCLSSRNLARIQALIGPALVRRMLFAAELVDAPTCFRAGFANWLVEPGAFEAALASKIDTIAQAAPLTLRATKAALIRLASGNAEDADIIENIYGSQDFAEGVAAFLARRPPVWKSR